MHVLALVIWVYSLLISLEPLAPWKDSYPALAAGIVAGAVHEPVFDGPLGVDKTVALDVAVARFESTFHLSASGDHGHSHGLYGEWNDDVPNDATSQTLRANRIMKQSFKACRALPFEERLAWYASGHADGCENEAGQKASRHRVSLMLRLFAKR